jgi:hypothetical protein
LTNQPATPIRFRPLDDAVAPARSLQRSVIADVLAWALAHGVPVQPDVVAFVLDTITNGWNPRPIPGPWQRPDVSHLVQRDSRNHATTLGVEHPDDRTAIWALFSHLDEAGLLDPASDPLHALLEPLQCYGGLDPKGRVRADDDAGDIDFACQCPLPYEPPSAPGLSRYQIGFDGPIFELWRPPRSADELCEWYRPISRFSSAARAEGSLWNVPIEDFTFVGRIEAHRSTPALWVYRHRRPEATLVVDADGQPHWPQADSRRRSGVRWKAICVSAAVWRSGIPAARRPHPFAWQDVDEEWLAELDGDPDRRIG